jgi:hypothetical protein
MRKSLILALAIVMAACGQPAATTDAQAQPQAAAASVSGADQAAILFAANVETNARGEALNECNEYVTPGFIPVDLGGQVGAAVLFVMDGGPNSASCYGDGPGLTLYRRNGADWQMIYSSRGAMLVVLPSANNGAKDLVQGGPGFEHPRYRWNGTEYAPAGRIQESAMPQNVTYLP